MQMPYHKEAEGISDPLHEQLILAEVFFVDVQQFGVVQVTQEEQGHEETNNHVHTGDCEDAGADTYCERDYLAAPEHEVQQLVLF